MKSKKALVARFKVTATGKLKHSQPGKRHIMTKKTPKRKRQLGQAAILDVSLTKTYKRLMCV
jgi:large subunit ribosomal protein L35